MEIEIFNGSAFNLGFKIQFEDEVVWVGRIFVPEPLALTTEEQAADLGTGNIPVDDLNITAGIGWDWTSSDPKILP